MPLKFMPCTKAAFFSGEAYQGYYASAQFVRGYEVYSACGEYLGSVASAGIFLVWPKGCQRGWFAKLPPSFGQINSVKFSSRRRACEWLIVTAARRDSKLLDSKFTN